MYKILYINCHYSMLLIFLFFVISCDYVFTYDMSIKSASCSLSFVMTYQCRGKNHKGRKDIFPEAIKTHTRLFQMQYNKCWTKWKRKRREYIIYHFDVSLEKMYSYIVSKITSPTHKMTFIFILKFSLHLSISEELYTNYTVMYFEHLPVSQCLI